MWQYVIAVVSSLVVLGGALPLYVGILRGERRLTGTAWIICSATALVMAIAYCHTAPLAYVGPSICTFVNTLIAFACMTWATRRGICSTAVFGMVITWIGLAVGGLALATFFSKMPSAAPYVLYSAMAFDAWIISGILRRLMREPDSKGALADAVCGSGYAVGMFGITEHSMATWALPIYMSFVSLVFISLVQWRRTYPLKGGSMPSEGDLS